MHSKPNLLFVFPDQMRVQTLGFLGQEPVQTPHLDAFAEESLFLTQAVANFPVCSPYRGMLMTGRYPFGSRVTGNCTSGTAPHGVELPADAVCWSDVLRDQDYSLGYIGKWHLDSPREPYIDCINNRGREKWNEWCPPERRHGFDTWYAYGTYDQHLRPMYWDNDADREDFQYVDQWGPEHEADQAIRYLRNEEAQRDPDKPFALVVSMNPPHMPYDQVPERYKALYADLDIEATVCQRPHVPPKGSQWGEYYREHIRNQYAMVTGVDEQFGRILQTLEEQGLSDNTLVVFTSDHGDCLGLHNQISKGNPYEESMCVPFLMRWPGHIAPGRDDAMISTPDIYPTLLDLMGCGASTPEEVEGESFAGRFLGKGYEPDRRSQLYLNIPARHSPRPDFGSRGVRTDRYTLVVGTEEGGEVRQVELYDRLHDPLQMWNQAEERKELVQELVEQELLPWLRMTNDPWKLPDPIFS